MKQKERRQQKAWDQIYNAAVAALENQEEDFASRIPVHGGRFGVEGGRLYSVSDPVPAQAWRNLRQSRIK